MPVEGEYQAFFPYYPGCVSVGETVEEALANAKEAIELHLEGEAEHSLESVVEGSYADHVAVGAIDVEVPRVLIEREQGEDATEQAPAPRDSMYGALADLGPAPTEEEIDENRKAMLGQIPWDEDAELTDYQIELEQEADGRWIAEIPQLPGVLVYGPTQAEAVNKVKALALRALADRLEHGEGIPNQFSFREGEG